MSVPVVSRFCTFAELHETFSYIDGSMPQLSCLALEHIAEKFLHGSAADRLLEVNLLDAARW